MLHFPEHIAGQPPVKGGVDRQWAIIGANGAGKARFALRMRELSDEDSVMLSPVANRVPSIPGPGLTKLLSELGKRPELARKVAEIWSRSFPESGMGMTKGGNIRFRSSSGSGTFGPSRLSRGEKTAAYFLCGVSLAPPDSLIFIDSPSLFLHPSAVAPLWDSLTELRADCRFFFITSDPVFLSARQGMRTIWVRRYIRDPEAWDYTLVEGEEYADELMLELLGSRRSVLFIEGDATHSIDARLYGALFPEYHVRPVGSCNKVIEATRTFSSMRSIHHLESHGLVDRDRRSDTEVDYLRAKGVMVPEVAEVENIFLTEGVLENMARIRKVNPAKVVKETRRYVIDAFRQMAEAQALQHVRHRMKRDVERKIDARFTCITALELHIKGLINTLRPRDHYQQLLTLFRRMIQSGDYPAILKVFNHKPLLTQSPAYRLLGYSSPGAYVEGVIATLRSGDRQREEIAALRDSIRTLFNPQKSISPPPLQSPVQSAPSSDRFHDRKKGKRRKTAGKSEHSIPRDVLSFRKTNDRKSKRKKR